MPGPIKPSKRDHLARAHGRQEHAAADVIRAHVDKRTAAQGRPTRRGLGIAPLLGPRSKSATKRAHL